MKNEAPLQVIDFKANNEGWIKVEDVESDEFSDHALPLLLIIDDHKDIVDYLKKSRTATYNMMEDLQEANVELEKKEEIKNDFSKRQFKG